MDRQIWGERAWESARAGGESSSLHHVGLRTSSINYLCMYACKVNLNRINVKCKIFKGQTPSFPVTIAQATTGRSSWSFQWIGFDAIFRSAHSAPPIRSKLAAAKLCCLSCFSFSGDQADDAAVNHGLVTLPACKARISRYVRHVYSQHRKKKANSNCHNVRNCFMGKHFRLVSFSDGCNMVQDHHLHALCSFASKSPRAVLWITNDSKMTLHKQ